MDIIEILSKAIEHQASDILLIAGLPVTFKGNGKIIRLEGDKLFTENCSKLIEKIYELAGNRDMTQLLSIGDDDFSFSLPL
jgi:twitching motility protein PilT